MNINRSLLGPLRTFMSSQSHNTMTLTDWVSGIESVLASLIINLERVEGALKDLQLDLVL